MILNELVHVCEFLLDGRDDFPKFFPEKRLQSTIRSLVNFDI